ncbi:hypothetical protein BDF22DRAFT_162177 [Syncephalis plumigaleata]|nr:hypothetical protein BDF22DRAFT_162177 [Syncephalis plumigaleata]
MNISIHSDNHILVIRSDNNDFIASDIAEAFVIDAIDVVTSTLITCGFFYNVYTGLLGYIKAKYQQCPRNQNLMLLVNVLQSLVCFAVGALVLVHHCAPWVFDCTVDMVACAVALAVSGGCVTGIMVVFAYQSAETTQRARALLAFGVVAVVATVTVGAFSAHAISMGRTTFSNCTMSAHSTAWIVCKLMVDLVTNFGLSLAYLSTLRRIVNDTGLPIYRVLFTHGLVGRFLVLLSNLICAALVAVNIASKWHVLFYSIDELLASTILNWQLMARHRALNTPLANISAEMALVQSGVITLSQPSSAFHSPDDVLHCRCYHRAT